MEKTPLTTLLNALFVLVGMLSLPTSALAASVSATLSAQTINSLGEFRVVMTSSDVTSCTWSRLDNGTTWKWKDQPLPSGTSYDSGLISGWAGPASYEWQFNCSDGLGSSAFGAIALTIGGDTGSSVTDIGDSLASVITSIIGAATDPNPALTPTITVLPTPLLFPDTDTSASRDIHLTLANTGGAGSLLTGSVSITGDPSFSCFSGCTYTNVPAGIGPDVVIRFTPPTVGPKTAVIDFSGGGGTAVLTSGTGIAPVAVVVATPSPTISVSPTQTLFFYNVEMGDYRDKRFTVRNVGPVGTLLTGTVAFQDSPEFTCVADCNYVHLGTTDTHTVTLRFRPSGITGLKIGQVSFSGGGGANRYLNGYGYRLSITGNLDFKNVTINSTRVKPLTVTNTSATVDIGTGTIDLAPPFSCVSDCAYSLPPGAHHTFMIGYTPTTPGVHNEIGSLSGYTESSFNFTGNGISPYFRLFER